MKKKGFTLAEVLIALAIVGVAAAMTIPTLVSNVNQKANETKAKATVTDLETAYGQAMLEADTENATEIGLNEIKKYMILDNDKTKSGACITISGTKITIDVNCDEKPNKADKDKFTYTLQANGTLKK